MTDNKLSNEDAELIAKAIDEEAKINPATKMLKELPSSNGKLERSEEEATKDKGHAKKVKVSINPETGERAIVGAVSNEEDTVTNRTPEEIFDHDMNFDVVDDLRNITEEELMAAIEESRSEGIYGSDILKEDGSLDSETFNALLTIMNRRLKNEKFNVYQSYPQTIKDMIDKFCAQGVPLVSYGSVQYKQMRNTVAEDLLDEFISNVQMSRIPKDFNSEVEKIFADGGSEIVDSIVGYNEERNKVYREYAEKIKEEDPEKSEKIITILDRIEEAYNLTELKEFCKKIKIKKFDLEKPERHFSYVMNKYANSTYNIYDINMARPILFRNLNSLTSNDIEKLKSMDDKDIDKEVAYSANDVNAFFIAFTKQCMNYHTTNVLEHSYLYYVLYNIVILDINKGDSKDISEKFLDNVKECIENLRERNKATLR